MSNVSSDADGVNNNPARSAYTRQRFYRLQHVSQMLSIPEATIRRWRCLGTGPVGLPLGVRVGGSVLFPCAAIDDYMAEKEQEAIGNNDNL